MTRLHARYPGSPPFADSEIDRLLFRGRAAEAERLTAEILSNDLIVVYGVSGTGKTSLMQAGVFHHLRAEDLWPVTIRLNDPSRLPTELILDRLKKQAAADGLELLLAGPAADDLWELLDGLEIWRGDVLLTPVFVLDQFEELFTLDWDPAVRERFLTRFGWVTRGHRPLAHGGVGDRPPAVKSVILVREDSLGELEALAGHVPHIMRNRFRLVALDLAQAEEAIRGPAGLVDDRLASPPFAFADDAVELLLDFLRTRERRGETVKSNSVEPSQLQIICQYVEDVLVGAREGVLITAGDLGGRDGLIRVLGDFYRRALAALPDEHEDNARRLAETGLINAAGRRLSLEVHQIEDDFGVPREMLDRLVAARLLRREERTGSYYYELAHDSLVQPIVDERAERLRAAAEARRRRLRRWAISAGAAALSILAIWGWIHSREGDSVASDEVSAEQGLRTVTGMVLGHGGDPLVGATVHFHRVLGQGAGAENGGVAAGEVTGASGRFGEELTGGTYRIEVTAQDYQAAWWGDAGEFAGAADVVIDEDTEPPEVRIQLAPLDGRIVYSVAAGSGGDVRAVLETGDARDGPQGAFTVPTPGSYTVTFTATGFEDLAVPVDLELGRSRDLGTVALVAEQPASVEVTFVKLIEGTPDAELTPGGVEIEYQIANNGAAGVTLQGIADPQLPGGRLDLSGRRLEPQEVITRTVSVTISEAVECGERREVPAELLLASGDSITASAGYCTVVAGLIGAVVYSDVDGDGERDEAEGGLSGVDVMLTYPDGTAESMPTDDFGRVQFASVPEGTYTVAIEPIPGTRATTELRQDVGVPGAGEVAIGVQSAVQLSGTVLLAGAPVANVTVAVGGDAEGSTTTDDGGRFRFAVYPGTYQVKVPGGLASRTVAVETGAVAGADLEVAARPPVDELLDGLFCRDLFALGYEYTHAFEYWELQQRPSRMDADGNDRPCETVYPQEDVDAVMTPPTTTVGN